MSMTVTYVVETPIGDLAVSFSEKGLASIEVASENVPVTTQAGAPFDGWFATVKKGLKAYFAGKPLTFPEVPIDEQGTDFQKAVWAVLRSIPYGKTLTYGEVAERVGGRSKSRAVGGACNKNPLLLYTPCHRVVGADKSLTGFACGVERKAELLALEAKHAK